MYSLFPSRDPDPGPASEPVPSKFPSISGADIAAAFVGTRVAGDFYDALRVSPQRVLFGLLDVAERRDDNRSILATAQDIFRNSGAELLSPADVNEAEAMTELTLRINRALIDTASGVLSCPAFLCCYHEVFGTLCYANTGHTPALLRDQSGISELGSTGLPLGLFSHATSESKIVALEKGAVLLLVSRGVVSCAHHENGSAGEFGLEGVKGILKHVQAPNAQALCASVLNSVEEFRGQAPVCDDRTALVLMRAL